MKRINWQGDFYSLLAMQLFEHDIFYMCRNYWIDGYDDDDLAQEFRMILWSKLPLYDPKKSSFRTWGKKVMMNKIRDLTRAKFAIKRRANNDTVSLDKIIELEDDYFLIS